MTEAGLESADLLLQAVSRGWRIPACTVGQAASYRPALDALDQALRDAEPLPQLPPAALTGIFTASTIRRYGRIGKADANEDRLSKPHVG